MVVNERYLHISYKKRYFQSSALGKGLEGFKVGGKKQSFSVLKHTPKYVADAIVCMIKISNKSKFCKFYWLTQGHLSYII